MHGSEHAAAGRRLPQETMDVIERAEEEPSSFEIILIWFHHILRWGLARGFRESLKDSFDLIARPPFCCAATRARMSWVAAILHGARCKLHAACGGSHVVCCMLYVACCKLHAAYGVLHVVCCMLYVACCMLHGACCLFRTVCCVRDASCAARRSARRSCSGLLLPASLVGPSRVRMVLAYKCSGCSGEPSHADVAG
jgi:hypothetical protein